MSDNFSMPLDEALRQAREKLQEQKQKRAPGVFSTADYMAANKVDYNRAYKELVKLAAFGFVERSGAKSWRFVNPA